MKTDMKKTFICLVLLLLAAVPVFADEGQVVKVVDGDTVFAEIDGKSGRETIEINLKCSDAPLLSSPFGSEAKQTLENFLPPGKSFSYKVMSYCGTEKCIVALLYIPVPEVETISYINTRMIEAGMARNDSCRGEFAEAEAAAKTAKKGIWSTSSRIAFTETVQKAEPKPQEKAAAPQLSQPVQTAPAVVKYDRVERTVTLKSRALSLTRAVRAIDAVSPAPVSVYLQNEEYVSINLEKAPWYEALRYIVEAADLKQVNLDGKIDLYTRIFYYKHVAPYLKIAGNVGVYMSAGDSVPEEQLKDDGVTRYVFINEFENSAEVAKQYEKSKERNQSSGFIQLHEGVPPAAPTDYGTFTRTAQAKKPVQVASVEPEPQVKPEPVEAAKPAPQPTAPERPPLKPYSGDRASVEESAASVEKVPVPLEKPVEKKPAAVEKPAAKKPEVKPVAAEPKAAASNSAETAPPKKEVELTEPVVPKEPSPPENGPVKKTAAPVSGPEIEFSALHAGALLFIVALVILGCFYLTRSAAAKAEKAEKHVDPEDLEEKPEPLDIDDDLEVDKQYEEEIFDQLDHVGDEGPAEETADPEDAEPAVEKHTPKPLSGKEKRIGAGLATEEVGDDDEAGSAESVHGEERQPRKICLFEVKCSSTDGVSFTGIGLDISTGGLFVDSKEYFDVGKVIELEFRLYEDTEEPVRCRGAVTWYNQRPDPIKPDYPNGFGVRFMEIDDSSRALIEKFLEPDDED